MLLRNGILKNPTVRPVTAYLQQLFQFGVYKRSQGRIARQVTFIALAVLVAAGAWGLKGTIEGADGRASTAGAIAIGVALLGFWAAYRLVQLPKFADFLISVEAEMNKVSWPGRSELWKASVVVILTIFVLAALLFLYDLLWKNLLGLII
ncbi:MAG: preprotein translocase subunit SecE [Planctomycetota bacterium]